jgi:hypothetical protein
MITSQYSDSPPYLWNPNAAACWSLLFSPAFGAFIHARNAETLGQTEDAKANKLYFYISLAYLGVVLISIFIPTIPDSIFRGAAIGLLIGWYFSLGKKQIKYVKETFQGSYQRKSWTKPLLIACGCFILYFVTVFILVIVADIMCNIS